MKSFLRLLGSFVIIVVMTGCASEANNTSSVPTNNNHSVYVSNETYTEMNDEGNSTTQTSSIEEAVVLPPEVTGKTLIGWWAEEPGIPSGEPPAYRFYENEEYIFSAGEQMTEEDTDHRSDECGFWALKNHTIEFTVTNKDNKALENPEQKVIELTNICYSDEQSNENGKYLSFEMDGTRYWKLSSDPDGYVCDDTTVLLGE